MDLDNPVVKLCSEGMMAEAQAGPEEALRLFLQAWEARKDDHDACIAAHYVARHQATPEEALRWNQLALHHADQVKDDRVRGFYPSLLLCVGKALEDLGRVEEARAVHLRAHEHGRHLPEDPYGDMIRGGIAAALRRLKVQGDPQPGAPASPAMAAEGR